MKLFLLDRAAVTALDGLSCCCAYSLRVDVTATKKLNPIADFR